MKDKNPPIEKWKQVKFNINFEELIAYDNKQTVIFIVFE